MPWRRARTLGEELGVLGLFAGLAVLFTRPLAFHLADRTLEGPDPLHFLWRIDWVLGHLLAPLRFFHGNIFFPFPFALLYSDFAFGSAILLAPLRPLDLDPVVQFNLATLAALTFSGWCFFRLGTHLSGSRFGGAFAGVGATFSAHQMAHVYHLNLLSTGWLALMLLGLERCLDGGRARWALLAGVGFAFTALSSGYYAVIAALVAVLWVLARLPDLRSPRTLWRLTQAAFVAVALSIHYVWAVSDLRSMVDMARPAELSESLAFVPARDLTSGAFLYRWALGDGGERLFPGLLTPLLALLALRRRRERVWRPALVALVLLILSLGPTLSLAGWEIPLPYAALVAVPPLDAMRHPYTFAAVASMLLCVIAAAGWPTLGLSARRWAGPVLLAVAVLELLGPGARLAEVPAGVPSGYRIVARLGGAPSFELPVRQGEALLWAARHGMPVANGYGAFEPPYTSMLHRTTRNHWMTGDPGDVDASKPTQVLRQHFADMRYLIVPTRRRHHLEQLVAALDASRTFVFVEEGEDGDRVYEIRHPGLPVPRP